jgi:hypothetical protein
MAFMAITVVFEMSLSSISRLWYSGEEACFGVLERASATTFVLPLIKCNLEVKFNEAFNPSNLSRAQVVLCLKVLK